MAATSARVLRGPHRSPSPAASIVRRRSAIACWRRAKFPTASDIRSCSSCTAPASAATTTVPRFDSCPTWMAQEPNRTQYPCFLIAPQCRPDRLWVETPRAFDRAAPRQPPGPQMQVVIDILDSGDRRVSRRPRAALPDGAFDGRLRQLGPGHAAGRALGRRGADLRRRRRTVCRSTGRACRSGPGMATPTTWCPSARSRRMIEAIRRAGGDPRYTELAGVGHDSWTPAYTDRRRPAALDVRAAKRLKSTRPSSDQRR